jgi:hypothetical protein
VEVTADGALCEHVAARGGVLWVRSTRERCCGGGITSLRATTSRPADADAYVALETDLPIAVRFLAAAGEPEGLRVELRGVGRKRPDALWDGCKFKL